MRKAVERIGTAVEATRCRPQDGRIASLTNFCTVATLFAALSATAAAQAPPILNSPYVCSNGITYTVSVCKPFGADQWCRTTEEQNGKLVTMMDSSWRSMTGRLQGCTNAGNVKQGNASASTPSNAPAQPAGAAQQSFNPPYLREFPSVDQITSQIKGSGPLDTANRQLTALREFGQMIAALAGPRMNQKGVTPDEARILTSYYNAYNSIAKAVPNSKDAYAGNHDFTASLFTTFRMPTIQQLWVASNNLSAGQQTASNSSQLQPSNDPTTLAARRCVELGGTMTQCTITGLGAGLSSLAGVNTDALSGVENLGLVLFGTYKAANGLAFNFGDTAVDIGGCGAMVQGSHGYTIQPVGNRYAIKISNDPQPLALVLGADGKIAGPVEQDISGQKHIGVHVVTNTRTGASTQSPIFGPVTVHCRVGTLQPGPPSAPISDLGTATSAAIDASEAMLSGDTQKGIPGLVMIDPGPRFVGKFASASGLKIVFDDAGAVLDCAQAHVKVPYDVTNTAGVMKIAFKNAGSPFVLTVASSGTLTGSGTTTVTGKLMTGLDGTTPILTSTNASCPVDSLTAAR